MAAESKRVELWNRGETDRPQGFDGGHYFLRRLPELIDLFGPSPEGGDVPNSAPITATGEIRSSLRPSCHASREKAGDSAGRFFP